MPNPASPVSDRIKACYGPRDLKPVGSVEWCWQTLNMLQIRWEKMSLQEDEFLEIVKELESVKAWEKIPPEKPYGSKDAMLLAEIGVTSADGLTQLRMRMAAARTDGQVNPQGGARGSNANFVFETIQQRALKNGISRESQRMLDVLARQHPALHQKVAQGELSICKAATMAGLRKPKVKPKSVKEEILSLSSQLSPTELQDLVAELGGKTTKSVGDDF